MGKIIGLISGNYSAKNMEGLIQNRPLAALPFGGRYRLLDFPLSNMVHSGIRTVGIITPSLYRPILDHLGSGKEWSLDRKVGGLFILPGTGVRINSRNNKFGLKCIQKNIDFLERDKAEYIAISDCNSIFKMDYRKVLEQHRQNRSDITLLIKEIVVPQHEDTQSLVLKLNSSGQVQNIKQAKEYTGLQMPLFAGMILMKSSILYDIIAGSQDPEYLDLMDIIEENISFMKVFAYSIPAYFGRIYSKQSYYERSMDLLRPEVRDDLFGEDDCRVLSRARDNPPTKFNKGCMINNSLIASGCEIQGRISGSIIFRGVQVEEGASITNCIIMHRCRISSGAVLENVIIDKYALIHQGTVIKGSEGNAVVINKNKAV